MREFVARPSWMTSALCRGLDPNLFFQERGDVFPSVLGDLCSACPVRADCLAYALTLTPDHGRWGGTTPKQRSKLRAQGEVQVHDGWVLYDATTAEVVFVTDEPVGDPDDAMAAVLDWLAGPQRVSA